MNVLITGGSGFIGRYFVEALQAAPAGGAGANSVTILDLVKPEWPIGAARFIQGDVRDPDLLARAVPGHDAILHLAAAHHDFGIEKDTYFSVNEHGTKLLCDAADAAGVRNICFYSTVAVYGTAPEPHFEDAAKAPASPYGASKLAGERVLREWTDKGGGRRTLVIRPTVTFGPRNFANMYTLIRQIASGKFLRVGPGVNIKSLSYVENIVAATIFLWHRPVADASGFDVYNYIDKPDLTSGQIAAAIYKALGKKPLPVTLPLGLAMLAALPFDLAIKLTGKNLPISSARIKKLASTQTKFEADKVLQAGFKPPVNLTTGIERMVRWYMAEGKNIKPVWHTPPPKVGGALVATTSGSSG